MYFVNGVSLAKTMDQAITVVSDFDSTQAQITAAENSLPTASQITTWVQQQAQKKAEEEVQKALVKKNTPSKTTLKKAKKVAKNKVKLTWKKVNKATGYEVYQSTKKNSGYKKVKIK